ncbi:MAG: hypothetical protein HKO08_02135 [Erythrobacter sp.]|nr:hypothetical protein [Erythrobacter sp.]
MVRDTTEEGHAAYSQTPGEGRSYGALVGWKTDDLHDRIILRMQTVTTPPPHSREDITQSVIVIDKNQAVQLGNHLFEVSGQTKPVPRRSWLARFFR